MLYAAGGAKLTRMIPGSLDADNIVLLHSKVDHEYMARELRRGVKRVAVLGANLESLELISTLRREYPKIHITVIDENRESALETQLGKDVANSLIQ
jgi:hypothetical protein